MPAQTMEQSKQYLREQFKYLKYYAYVYAMKRKFEKLKAGSDETYATWFEEMFGENIFIYDKRVRFRHGNKTK